MNWISDFVDFTGLDKLDLIHRFSLSTAEVENEIFFKGSDISGIVVAEIKSVENHPDSKKLHLLKVDAGDGELVDVVCGAPNVRVGLKTAFAKVGAHIGDIEIAPRKLAGYTSNGMCCSEKEIGISDDNSGIMEITDDFENGTDIKEAYQVDDIIFEVDNKSLTNRPDLWGHYGIAREFAALAGRELKPLDVVDLSKYDNLPKVDLKIEDDLCQRYSCLQVENINTSISPVNMRIRLYYCGMRAINFLADLTNYLMLEMGQPMHAFDSRKVEKIRIKRFEKPFVFRTLDGVDRNIDENTLMICNGDTPVAIAQRNELLDVSDVSETINSIREDVFKATIDAHIPPQSLEEMWDIEGLQERLKNDFDLDLPIKEWLDKEPELHEETLRERILQSAVETYQRKEEVVGAEMMRHFEKGVMLQTLDSLWKEHLAAMDYLRQGIHLRGYAQKDPKQEYKRESFSMFAAMLESLKYEVISTLSKVQVRMPEEVEAMEQQRREEAERLAQNFVWLKRLMSALPRTG